VQLNSSRIYFLLLLYINSLKGYVPLYTSVKAGTAPKSWGYSISKKMPLSNKKEINFEKIILPNKKPLKTIS
jgi:hypothetical protein